MIPAEWIQLLDNLATGSFMTWFVASLCFVCRRKP
ncbi:hypothetical protein SAMN05444166_4167 [Singulisphaera sp. GP187]|nr:hypothetical protein SAMN05444166_4167 [Singulisphaera sp. GP187]